MASSVNKVILVGNLGNDPEIRILENKTKLARFSLATSENYTDTKTGERREITDWHNIIMWRGLAEIAEKYLKKGQKVYLEGKIKNRAWKDENNLNRYTTEIVVDNMVILSKGKPEQFQQPNFTPENLPDKPTPFNADMLSDEEDDGLPF